MLQTFIITLREGVEASLVIAIAIAYLKKIGRLDLLSTVYQALSAAVIACFIGAWGFSKLEISDDAYEGWLLLASAVFVLSMVVWMNSHGQKIKGEIETGLQKNLSGDPSKQGSRWGIFFFVFLMVFREGVETVLMLAGVGISTSGVLEITGAVLGIGLAVLFGVSFVRGTIRVNMRQFFQMTTAILLVVVFQLVISGLHELSESEILPAGPREMALIGPIVKNDSFFFVTILVMALAMLLLEWRKRRGPVVEGLEGAALRRAKSVAQRDRRWMIASCTASCLFILLVTAEFVYAAQSTALSAAEQVTLTDGSVRIPVSSVNDGDLHRFSLDDSGISVRFIVIERPDHTLSTALDACQICGTQGFYKKGPNLICRNCASALLTSTIGTKGGCNPIPLASHVEAGTLVIDSSAFEPGARVFARGTTK